MSLQRVRAELRCDGCMSAFSVELDGADEGKCVMDIVDEAVRDDMLDCSLQGEMHLCKACTLVVDDANTSDLTLSADQVNAILDEKVRP